MDQIVRLKPKSQNEHTCLVDVIQHFVLSENLKKHNKDKHPIDLCRPTIHLVGATHVLSVRLGLIFILRHEGDKQEPAKLR